MRFRITLLVLLTGSLNTLSVSQTVPVSDPRAVSLVSKSMATLAGSNMVTDVTLTGNITWIAGSDNDTGTVTLMAKGIGESRMDLALPSQTSTTIRNDTAGYPQGASVANNGSFQPSALHNCWISASWFFPALSVLASASDSSLVFSYVGAETRNGISVQHVRTSRYLSKQKPNTIALTQRLSTMDIYLDSRTLLPTAFVFNTHPDDDAMTDVLVEIDFSKYQPFGGIQVPMHIRKLLQGGLHLDINITAATFNSGLPDSLFEMQ